MLIPNMILKTMSYVYICCFCLHVTKVNKFQTFYIDEVPVGRLLRTLCVLSRAARASEAR